MSTNLVIVAIPEETDRVWKVSSERVPHLTLLHLGEAEGNPHLAQIVQFVQHAVELSEHGQFYLDVDYRGTLGDAEADVLYFSKRSWNLKWIKQFRGQLLQNQQIRTAFDATPQIQEAPQEWLPHLTLGYPNTPAKPLPDDGFEHPIYSVCFDRIAVWTEDYDGPEFRLEWPDRELEGDLAIAYSDTQKAALMHDGTLDKPVLTQTAVERGEEFLEHYGKKGMKWGVRNDDHSNARGEMLKGASFGVFALASPSYRRNVPGPTKMKVSVFGSYALLSGKVRRDLREASQKTAVQKADSKWEKGVRDGSAFVAIHNAASDHFNANIAKVNAKHSGDIKQGTKNVDDPSTWGPKYKSYMKDIDGLTKDSIKHAANELYLKNPSGTKEVEIHQGPSGQPGDYTLKVKSNHSIAGKAGSAGSGTANFGGGKVGGAGSGTSRFGHSAVEAVLQHAANDVVLDDVKVTFTRDSNGFVTGFEFPDEESSLAQTVDLGKDFLEHYGVKGMQWGVRNTSRSTSTPAGLFSRKPPKAVAPKATSKVPHGSRRKTKVETEGGENHPAHEDALKVAKSTAKLKKSGTKALSNQELQDLANRVRLEEQAVQATRSKGSKWVRKLLGNQGNQAVNQVIRTEVNSRLKGNN